VRPVAAGDNALKHRCFQGFGVQPQADYVSSRTPLLFNHDCVIAVAAPPLFMQAAARGKAKTGPTGHGLILVFFPLITNLTTLSTDASKIRVKWIIGQFGYLI
jgi:hypothetical protein